MVALILTGFVVGCGSSHRRRVTVVRPMTTVTARPSLTQRLIDWTGLSGHLPRNANGTVGLLQIAGSRLEINPSLHDPLTALSACADLVTGCYGPTLPLDTCVQGARSCSTEQPWNESACCPTACLVRYRSERQSGRAPLDAFETVFFREPDCFPGVRSMLVRSQ